MGFKSYKDWNKLENSFSKTNNTIEIQVLSFFERNRLGKIE